MIFNNRPKEYPANYLIFGFQFNEYRMLACILLLLFLRVMERVCNDAKQRKRLERMDKMDIMKSVIEKPAATAIAITGLFAGNAVPDFDIPLLGIGWHRFFLFHSAAGAWLSQRLYLKYKEQKGRKEGESETYLEKAAPLALAAFSAGVGLHLAIDVFQPKAVIFPFVGSLINGTLVDDNLWLAANSYYSFKISGYFFKEATGKTPMEYAAAHFDDCKNIITHSFMELKQWLDIRANPITK